MKLFELYNVLKDGQNGRNNFLVTVIQGNGTGSRYFLAGRRSESTMQAAET